MDRKHGLNVSHYEFDFDLLTETGEFNNITIKGVGRWRPIEEQFADLKVLRFHNWLKLNKTPWLAPPPYSKQEYLDREFRDDWNVPPLRPDGAIDWTRSLGVPLHVCLHIANVSKAHAWINLPHCDSAENFTELMHYIVDSTLEQTAASGLKPIFEFSNEVWNAGFMQHGECANLQMGRPIDTPFDPGQGFEVQQNALAWQVARTNEIAEYVGDRAHVALGTQVNNPNVAATLLDHELSPHVDALAIAPYYGNVRDPRWSPKDILPHGFHPLVDIATGERFSLDDPQLTQRVYENLEAYIVGRGGFGGETKRMLTQHAEVVRKKRLQLWMYEGGPDLHCRDGDAAYHGFDLGAVREFYRAFSLSREMGWLVETLLKTCHSFDIPIICTYSAMTAYKRYSTNQRKINYDNFGFINLNDTKTGTEYEATWKLYHLVQAMQ